MIYDRKWPKSSSSLSCLDIFSSLRGIQHHTKYPSPFYTWRSVFVYYAICAWCRYSKVLCGNFFWHFHRRPTEQLPIHCIRRPKLLQSWCGEKKIEFLLGEQRRFRVTATGASTRKQQQYICYFDRHNKLPHFGSHQVVVVVLCAR